jgi:3-oxoacyl-[acyl-carrier-protein] synthase II
MTGAFVVTGVGWMSAAGDTPEAAFARFIAGVPLVSARPIDGLGLAEMEGFDAARYIPGKGIKDLSRLSQLACSAAAANARGMTGVAPEDVGVVFGSAWGSLKTVIEFEREAHLQGARFVDPILFTETVSNVPAGQVAIRYGWSAFNATVSSGSASGLAGLRQALSFLEEGRGSVAVAGGGDELNRPLLRALRLRGGPGPVGGEGACFLSIETEAHAKERGAGAIAAIRATGGRFDDSLAGLIRQLASRAELDVHDIDLVVISASSLLEGPDAEARAVLDVFGGGASAPPVLVPKSVLGETWGASGVFAAALAIEAMRRSTVPAAPRDFRVKDALASLHVPRETLRRPLRNALILDSTEAGQQLGLVVSGGAA